MIGTSYARHGLHGKGICVSRREVLRDLVVRVEIHSASVQLVINLKALKDLNPDDMSVPDLEKKLWVGDRLMPESSRRYVRLSIWDRQVVLSG